MPVRRTVTRSPARVAPRLAALMIGAVLAPPVALAVGGCSSGMAPLDRAAVQAVLDRRAQAVLRHDPAAWAATAADPADPAVLADPAGDALFTRLEALPVTTWRYEIVAISGGATSSSPTTQRDSTVVDVRLSYRLAADSRDVTRDQVLTVGAGTDGDPRVIRTEPVPGAEADPWDVGPVTVRAGARSLVVVSGDDPTARERAQDLAGATDRAALAVDDVWGTGGPRQVVVLAPATPEQARTILGSRRALGDLAALTVGMVSATDGRGTAPQGTADRVVLNPAQVWRLSATGQDVVLRHELTHVATRAASPWTPPLWLQEGFATWVGYSGSGAPAATVAADALPAVRRGVLPAAVPADAAFDAASGDVAAAYAQSWVLCDLLADEVGRAGLVAFYRAAAGIDPPATSAPAALATAFTRSGRSPEELVAQWRQRLSQLARTGAASGSG